MSSFEVSYDDLEDVLEVTFGDMDGRNSQSIALCDTVFIFTDLTRQSVWGVTIYNYRATLDLDFLCLVNLLEVSSEQAKLVSNLLEQPPIDQFLKIVDFTSYNCEVMSPTLVSLIDN